MAYPQIPLTAVEQKFFYCEVCGKSLLAKRDFTTCQVCGSRYVYDKRKMKLVTPGFIPTTSRLGLEQEMELIEEQAEVRLPVPALMGQVMIVRGGSPLTGHLTGVTMHFPNGCNSLVQIRVGIRQLQLSPFTGWIALNDATPQFPVRKEVVFGERLWVEVNNGDVFPHTPSVVFDIRGYRKIWQR